MTVCALRYGVFSAYSEMVENDYIGMKFWMITAALSMAGIICMGAGSKAKGYLITFHLEGDESEAPKFATAVALGSERRQYFFKKMPAFTDQDIAWFYPFVSQDGASFGAAFRLKDHKAQELAGLTVANQGRLFGTRVLDAPLRAVVIDRPINDGIVVIWDGLSKNHLKLIETKIPHSDNFQGLNSVPDFDLPNAPQTSTGTNSNNGEGVGTTRKMKPFSKLFGNSKKNSGSANPFANPTQ